MPKRKRKKKDKLDFNTLTHDVTQVEVPAFHLQNVVSTFSLGCSGLNLKRIAPPGTTPDKFPLYPVISNLPETTRAAPSA